MGTFYIQPNFNGSNTFGTMKRCSRQEYFELLSLNHNAMTGGIIGISFQFNLKICYCFHYNRLEAIVISKHNIPLSIYKKKIIIK